ncbi:hypothetical protein NDU88_004847 [Pleurodeles waltl]|uniref:Uncharacterized protein n=1 Tax=Pleurodeles waltl TaxID=8319 RepID=A0AAV7VJY3_PLEWA|nr:hypothetical protein NDU88_004847 [Pleurodeles waltl]
MGKQAAAKQYSAWGGTAKTAPQELSTNVLNQHSGGTIPAAVAPPQTPRAPRTPHLLRLCRCLSASSTVHPTRPDEFRPRARCWSLTAQAASSLPVGPGQRLPHVTGPPQLSAHPSHLGHPSSARWPLGHNRSPRAGPVRTGFQRHPN